MVGRARRWRRDAVDSGRAVVICLAWLLAACLVVVVLIGALRSFTPTARRVPGILPSRAPSGAQRAVGGRAQPGRYVLTIPAPTAESPTTPNSSSPPVPQPADTRIPADGDSRTISIAVLGPLAIDGLNRRVKRAATHSYWPTWRFTPRAPAETS